MSLPTVEPPDTPPDSGAVVRGLLLAAGTSERFGARNKLLAAVDGEPVVRRAALSLCSSGVADTTVVVGHEADRVEDALAGLGVRTVHNDRYEAGQSTSLGRGIEAVREGADAVVVALGDMPCVAPDSVDALLAAYAAGAGDALAAACRGERGNPVLFDAAYFDDLADVGGDTGGRAILLEDGTLVETGDPGVRRDVDTPEDLPRDQ